ncbi:MAG: hypothetical protein R3Y63_15495 [Eubacteriales bacterium]
MKNDNKERVVAWLPPDMIHTMDIIEKKLGMKNHTELVQKAVDFYIGYMTSRGATDFLSDNILSAIQGSIQATENRTSANLFRLSVETSMMMHLLALTLDVSEEELYQLRGICVKEVKKTNGKIKVDTAINFQKQNEDDDD